MSVTTILPTSGAVLGALVDDLQLDIPPDLKRTAREYFAGRRPTIKDETRAEIVAAIATALVEQGYVTSFGTLPEPFHAATTADAVGWAIACCTNQWDELVGRIQSEGLVDVSKETAAVAALRPVIVDLAIRAAAGTRLAGGRPAECTCDLCVFGDFAEPSWPRADGQRVLMQAIVEQVGTKNLEDFAAKLGIADGAIDGWLRPASPSRPSTMAIDTLAKALANLDPGVEGAQVFWERGLRWRLALGAIADRLAAVIGRPRVMNFGWALERCYLMAAEFFRNSKLPDDRFRTAMLADLMQGVRGPSVNHVLKGLSKREPEESWSRAICEAGNDWFTHVTAEISGEGARARAAETLQREDGLPPETAKMFAEIIDMRRSMPLPLELLTTPRAKSTALVALFFEAHQSGDFASAVVYLNGAIEEEPGRPELHQDLGAHLGKLGRFDEGVAACRRALELRPGWSSPQIQIGIMLLDAGRDAEALEHLEALDGNIEWSITFGYILGNARLRTNQLSAAIDALERVLAKDENHALALDAAAHCYLMIGDSPRGPELAKRAHVLRHDVTFRNLKAGEYRRLKRSR